MHDLQSSPPHQPSPEHRVTSVEQLRDIYRSPSERVQAKKAAQIDELTRQIIEASPFFLLATSSPGGACDVSPRGGPSGQLIVLDDHHVAFPDLSGNNLLDSVTNIIENPQAGLLVLTPGRDETLRIDGPAMVSTDPDLLGKWDSQVRRPKVAIVIEVANTFIHCAKAFQRSELWNPESWRRFGALPDYVELFLMHSGESVTPESISAMREGLDASYVEDLTAEQPR